MCPRSDKATGDEKIATIMSGYGRLCCKSRFVLVMKNSAGRTFSFRVRMRGTSSPRVKRTGDFGNATEGIRIGDQFPSLCFRENSETCNFRLLQQYRHQAAVRECPLYVGFG